MKNDSFREVNLTLIISVLLSILFSFWSILVLFGGFGKIKKSKMADPKWPPFENMT